jgi:hypothetical protein
MTEPSQPPEDGALAEVRPLPVLAEGRTVALERPRTTVSAPVVAATGGMLAGMLTMALVRVLRRGPRTLVLRRRRRGDRALEIMASRSFLVDVHVLKR